jgi:hypothetical protein
MDPYLPLLGLGVKQELQDQVLQVFVFVLHDALDNVEFDQLHVVEAGLIVFHDFPPFTY